MEVSTVKEVIRNLAKKTQDNGCTEAEALSAAKKIGELLKVYNLEITEVFLANANCNVKKIPTGRQRRHPIDSCCTAIANFCDCKVWFGCGVGQREYNFFGLESDTEMAEFLYSVIYDAIEQETWRYKQSIEYAKARNSQWGRKSFTVSFQKGMANRISERLNWMAAQRKREEKEEEKKTPYFVTTGTSLVLVKQNKVKDEFEKLSLRLRKTQYARNACRADAYYKGQAAGEKVNLSRPLNDVEFGGFLK